MASFSAQVDSWTRETKGQTVAVFRESAQRVTEVIQTPVAKGGAMRVDTGFLRASLSASIAGDIPALRDNPAPRRAGDPDGPKFAYGPGPVSLVIMGAEIGDRITFAYAANYAAYVENRYAMVRLGAQRWPQIVEEVAREARRGSGA